MGNPGGLEAMMASIRSRIMIEMRAIENVVRAVLREAGLKLGTPERFCGARARNALLVCERRSLLLPSKLP
jgi:hypothetical protein